MHVLALTSLLACSYMYIGLDTEFSSFCLKKCWKDKKKVKLKYLEMAWWKKGLADGRML